MSDLSSTTYTTYRTDKVIFKGGDMQMPAQTIFNMCSLYINTNTTESNKNLSDNINIFHRLPFLTNSEGHSETLLGQAAFWGNLVAVEILLDNGANVNHQNDCSVTPFHYAIRKGHFEVANFLYKNGADPNLKKEGGFSSLHIAVEENDGKAVEELIKMRVSLDEVTEDGYSPLQIAFVNKHYDIALLLIKCGAEIPLEVRNTPILVFLISNLEKGDKSIKRLMKELIDRRENPYNRYQNRLLLSYVVFNMDLPTSRILCRHDTNLQKLCKAIEDEEISIIQSILDRNPFNSKIKQEELQAIFLIAVNNHKFRAASIIYSHQHGLSQLKQFKHPEQDAKVDQVNGVEMSEIKQFVYECRKKYYEQLQFEHTIWKSRKEAISDAYALIEALFYDVPTCIELLKQVEKVLEEICPSSSKVKPEKGIIASNLRWPSPPKEGSCFDLEAKHYLRSSFREILQKHGIDTQEELYTFAGFVNTEKANQIVGEKKLFKEQFLLGNALIHGLYTHYIQWVIIALAFESGKIKFKQDLTLKEVFQSTVQVSDKDDRPAWTLLIDSLSHLDQHHTNEFDKYRINPHRYLTTEVPLRYHFGSPHELNSYLLFSEELPHLRGCLIAQWHNAIIKLQRVFSEKYNEEINYATLVFSQAVAENLFNGFSIGLTKEDVARYYANQEGVQVDQESGIVCKKK